MTTATSETASNQVPHKLVEKIDDVVRIDLRQWAGALAK